MLGQRSLIGRGAVAKRLASVLDGKLRGLVRVMRRRKLAKLIALIHPGFHQIPNTTALNRYPEIFACAANAAPDARRILSFGCSTGEECVTLASYFPAAQIVGTDINPLNLLKALKHRNDRVRFVYASDRILSGFGGASHLEKGQNR